jgi:eukaryotic-like serine/threonine-protein kinase
MIPDNSTNLSERQVFTIARELTNPEERIAYLAQIERLDQGMAERVRRLLIADGATHSFLDFPSAERLNKPEAKHTPILKLNSTQIGFSTSSSESEGSPLDPEFPRDFVAGYEIEAVLGRGGMSVVYQARHVALKRLVALKMMLVGAHASPEQRARFRVEAEAVARLQHPNIVQIHEVGESSGYPYCALEYVAGGTLAEKLGGKPMPPKIAAQLVQILARAMQLAHSRNVVHRDLKPANIMMTTDGTPKITDFGLARQLDQDNSNTRTGVLMGTPSYMAPEQASGHAHEAGPPADVYALGAILYDCLTGHPPFQGKTLTVILDQVLSQEPVSPSRLTSGVPIDLETICLKCLRKEPENRYASAQELAEELARFQNGEPILARPISQFERTAKWVKRNPALTVSLLIVAIVLSVVTAASVLVAERFREMALTQSDLAAKETASRIASEEARDYSRRELYHAESTLAMRLLGQPGSQERQQSHVARWAEEPESANLFGWEWRLSQNLAKSRATTYLVDRGAKALEFSPDGKTLAVGDRGITLLDSETMQLRQQWDCGADIEDLQWEQSGSRIAISSRNRVSLFDTQTGNTVWQQAANSYPRMTWDPLSRWVAYSDRRHSCRIADSKTGETIQTLKEIDEAFAFSPDGSQFVAAVISPDQTHSLRFWRTSDWTAIRTVPIGVDFVYAMIWSPYGKQLAVGTAVGEVIFFDSTTGNRTHSLESNGLACGSLAWKNDGQLLAASQFGGTIRVWECASWSEVPLVRTNASNSRVIRWRPTGKELLAGSDFKQFRSWSFDQHAYWTFHFGSRLTNSSYLSCAWHPNSRSLAGSGAAPGTTVWGVDGSRQRQINGVEWQWTSDAKYSASVLGEYISVWDSNQKRVAQVELRGQPKVLAWQPNSHTLAIRTANRIHLWNPTSGKPPEQVYGETRFEGIDFVSGNPMIWSPDGKRLAFGEKTNNPNEEWQASVMEVADRSIVQRLSIGKFKIRAIAWSPDGQRLGIGREEPVARIYDVASGNEIEQLVGHGATVHSIAWHPRETRLVTGSADGTAKVWDTLRSRPTVTFDLGSVARHVSWSPDGHSLAAAAESGTIHVWNSQMK